MNNRQRALHPGAWWLWAIGLAAAASRTTNPLALTLIAAVCCLVVASRRSDAPWALAFRMYLGVAVFVVLLRLGYHALLAGNGLTILFELPELCWPGSDLCVLGPVSAEAVLSGIYSGMQLGVMIVCVGAANALANPKRLLSATPGAVYELGSVIVIACAVFPQLAESVQRVSKARQLRSGRTHSRHLLREVFLPVFADALDRSLNLAAAMDGRGYGRRNTSCIPRGDTRTSSEIPEHHPTKFFDTLRGTPEHHPTKFFDTLRGTPEHHPTKFFDTLRGTPERVRDDDAESSAKVSSVLIVVAVLALCVGSYSILDSSAMPGGLGLGLLVGGLLVAGLGFWLAGLRNPHTRYRPDPWRGPESLTAICGIAVAVVFVALDRYGPDGLLHPPVGGLSWPQFSIYLLAGVLVAALPAFCTPAPPSSQEEER
ncbi:MAG: energy-coupling factor transporter transmembrane protein EcfT [Propionibacteriaceae bacterium]|jgi:energy-coupling factor transporter transmembrane protein EcfT|nr:energy-coupling factor transporter transmembrane protein EcfT [Propionibacteriaceae bacterium]